MVTKNKEYKHDLTEEENSESDVDESDQVSEASENRNENVGDNELLNAGWVDSISKILNTKKPKGKKTIVLSKAKKLTDLKKDKPLSAGYKIQTLHGEIKEEIIDDRISHSDEPLRKKRRNLPNLRIKPNILEKDRERTLQKIATKGVVQLFNAVKKQQKEIDEKLKEAGPLEAKQEKVLKNIDKRAFLDVLMGEKSQKIEENVKVEKRKQKQVNNKEKDTTWSVLKDDFMMTAKMKDWDKELDTFEEHSDKSD